MAAKKRKGPLARFGPYEIVERLGQGGMCHVFRARHVEAGVECALKLLRQEKRGDPRVRDLFVTEADLALMLDHPNLVRTIDSGEIDGRTFIAMELMEGGNLGAFLSVLKKSDLVLPYDLALYVASEVLEGLHSLHETQGQSGRPLGLIHRDVTPQNIFLSFDGRVILGDFGVALIQAYGDADPGYVLGKLGYLAPEMVAMEEVDRRADLFAMGVILYEMLVRERLFVGDEADVMDAIVNGRIPRPRKKRPDLARELEEAMLCALARRPRDRFESAESMMYALQPLWSQELANPTILAALLTRIYPEEARAWHLKRTMRTSDLKAAWPT